MHASDSHGLQALVGFFLTFQSVINLTLVKDRFIHTIKEYLCVRK